MNIKKHTSEDLWLVKLLAGAAFSAILYFATTPGSVVEQLGLVSPAVVTQAARVVSATAPNTVTVSTFDELIHAVSAATNGETIQLNPGVYGNVLSFSQWGVVDPSSSVKLPAPTNTDYVTITSADPMNRAVMIGVHADLPYFIFKDLSFRVPPGGSAFETYGVSHIKLLGNDVSSQNAADATNWTVTDWNNKVAYAFMGHTAPTDSEIAYNNVRFVRWGILAGAGTSVHDNFLQHLAGDESRAWGPNTVFENNYFSDNYQIDGNHNDFLQSFIQSTGTTTVLGVTARNNSFIGYDSEAAKMRIASTTNSQGFGLFDGFYKNWDIENNLVVVDKEWHGIAMYGGIDSTISRNLVADAHYSDTYGPAWILLTDTKQGSSSVNTTVTNNYATYFNNVDTSPASGNVTVTLTDYPKYFKDYANYDWTINPGALPFSVGANLDMTKVAPTPYQDITTPMDTTTVVPTTNNTVGGVVTSGSSAGTSSTPVATTTTPVVLAPILTLSLSPITITTGQTATVTWSTTNADSCTASGSWNGTEGTSGSHVISQATAGTYVYTLSCVGTGGTATDSVTLTVNDQTVTQPPSSTSPATTSPATSDITVGSRVQTTANLRVHSLAGLLGKTYGIQRKGQTGTVVTGPVGYDGYTWWKVDFDTGKDGWVAGEYLQGI